MAFIAAALFASCSDDKDYSGDFGQIKVPDTRQLEQTVSADDTQSARGVTFTTEGAWTSTIAETRAEAPAWISISPDRGDAAGSYTLKITKDVVTIALLYLPILAIAFVQAQLVKGAPKHASWKMRGVRVAGSALGVFLVMFFGYFGPVTIKPKTTYGWAWQNTYYTYGYLAGTIEATSLMSDPIIEPENYTDTAVQTAAQKAGDYVAPASPESAEDYPDVVLILSESFYDFDLVTDLQADTDIMPVTKNLPNSVYGHTISPHVGGGTNSTEYEMLTSNSLILMPSITPVSYTHLTLPTNSLV